MIVEQELHTLITAAFRFVVALDGVPLGAFTECTLDHRVEYRRSKGRRLEYLRTPTPRPKEIKQDNIEKWRGSSS